MHFKDLKFTAKIKACKDYKKGHKEAYDENISLDEVYSILIQNNDDYSNSGKLKEEEY